VRSYLYIIYIDNIDPYNDFETLKPEQKALLGICCLLLWVSIVQFFPINSATYSIAATMQTAFPRILAFLASFLPVYCAFMFLAIVLFGSDVSRDILYTILCYTVLCMIYT
jgi:hypothetical protein